MDFLNSDLTWLLTLEQFRYMLILKVHHISLFIWKCFEERHVECELLFMDLVCIITHLQNGFCAVWRTNLQMKLFLTYFTVIYMYISNFYQTFSCTQVFALVLLLIIYLLLEEFYFLHFVNGSYLVGLLTNWNVFHSFRWLLNIILIDSQLNTGTVVIIFVKWLLLRCVHEIAKIAVLEFERAEGPSWVCKLAFPDRSVGI